MEPNPLIQKICTISSFQHKLPKTTPPTHFIYLSTWNVKSMQAIKWGKRKYKWLIEDDDSGWLQRHDIAVLTDTKLSSLDIPRRRTPFFKGYYETHACHSSGDKIWGVSIFSRKGPRSTLGLHLFVSSEHGGKL